MARAFLLSIETGQNVGRDWLQFAYERAAQAGFQDCGVVPDVVWEQAAAGLFYNVMRLVGRLI